MPLSDWLRAPLLPLLQHHVTDGRLVAEGWIDRRGLREAVETHSHGLVDRSALLWPLLVAGLWLDGLRGD